MPSEEQEEVINILDEPPNKKQCVDEDITEKISVSSASIQSVDIDEITDDSDVEVNEIETETRSHIATEDNDDIEQISENNGDNNIISNEVIEETVIEEINEDLDKDNEVNITPVVEDSQGMIELNNDTDIDTSLEINTNIEDKEIEQVQTASANDSIEVSKNIYEAQTQLPLNDSIDEDKEEHLELSMEIGYADRDTTKEKVTALENLVDDPLPSTNDTDDIITCGQAINIPEEVNKNNECTTETNIELGVNEAPLENGIDKSPITVENGIETDDIVSVKAVNKNNDLTVEDMLADFVDEVIDEDKNQE